MKKIYKFNKINKINKEIDQHLQLRVNGSGELPGACFSGIINTFLKDEDFYIFDFKYCS